MDLDFKHLVKHVSAIKLQGGVFTKASVVLIIVCVCLTVIAFKSDDKYIHYCVVAIIFILTIVILLKLIAFANKNPQAALLEGAQFLVHEQIQLAAKGIPKIKESLNDLLEDTPIHIDQAIIDIANQPEEDNSKEEGDKDGN